MLLEQIKAVEAERDTLLARIREASAAQAAGMLLGLKASGAEFAALLWSEGMFRSFTNRWSAAAYPVWS